MTLALLALLFLAALMVVIGALVALLIDGRPQYAGFMDRLSIAAEVLAFLLWPVALPLLMRGHRHAARRR